MYGHQVYSDALTRNPAKLEESFGNGPVARR